MLPFLSVVTGSSVHIPRIDLAPVIRRLCENYWKEAGGSEERLNLRLEQFANLLIADDATELGQEPSAPSITAARQYVEEAGCRLIDDHERRPLILKI